MAQPLPAQLPREHPLPAHRRLEQLPLELPLPRAGRRLAGPRGNWWPAARPRAECPPGPRGAAYLPWEPLLPEVLPRAGCLPVAWRREPPKRRRPPRQQHRTHPDLGQVERARGWSLRSWERWTDPGRRGPSRRRGRGSTRRDRQRRAQRVWPLPRRAPRAQPPEPRWAVLAEVATAARWGARGPLRRALWPTPCCRLQPCFGSATPSRGPPPAPQRDGDPHRDHSRRAAPSWGLRCSPAALSRPPGPCAPRERWSERVLLRDRICWAPERALSRWFGARRQPRRWDEPRLQAHPARW